MRLPSQVALVTGAASGISRAVAIRFAQEGAAVMVADGSERGGMETVDLICSAGGTARFARLDVSMPEEVKQVVRSTVQELGDLHIVFNGAGILAYGTALETTEDAWNRMIAVNLTGTFCAPGPPWRTWCPKAGGRLSTWRRPRALMMHARMRRPM
jgi:NAD(P)-dependent dehydrogenase (short-subunit alcohol dehydrogenase family)